MLCVTQFHRKLTVAVVIATAALGCSAPRLRPGSDGAQVASRSTKIDEAIGRASFDLSPPDSSANTDGSRAPELARRVQLAVDLGRAKEAEGRVEDAVLEYQRALDLAAGSQKLWREGAVNAAVGTAHHRMAVACDRLGRFPQSGEHYAEALKLRPKDAKVWNDAGYSDSMQGDLAGAAKKLREAIRLAPTDARTANNLGLVLASDGKIDEAVEVMTRRLGPAAAHANVAYVLAAEGKVADARRHYERAAMLQPSLQTAKDALVALDQMESRGSNMLAKAPVADESVRPASATGSVDP